MQLPPTLSASEANAIRAFVARVRQMLGPDLREAWLFGSRARGEGHEHSDIDIALIVTGAGRAKRYDVYDVAFDLGLHHGVELAPVVIDEQRLRELESRERQIATDITVLGVPL